MKFTDSNVRAVYRGIRARIAEKGDDERSKLVVRELVLNVAGGCNLACPYCFASQGLYSKSSTSWMSADVAEKATTAMLSEHPYVARVKYFGGEPFMNLDAIEASFDVLDDFEKSGRGSIERVCVTNMTIFSPRIVKLVRRGLRITFSVDGPPGVHDANRKFTSGRGSFAKIVEVLEEYRRVGVRPSAVECVYTPRHLKEGITLGALDSYLRSTFDVDDVIIVPCFDGPVRANHGNLVGEAEFAEILRDDAAEFESSRLSQGLLEKQNAPLMQLIGKRPATGWCGLGVETLTVAQDGSLLPCYTLLQDAAQWTLRLVARDSETETVGCADIYRRLRAADPRRSRSCSDCDIREVCRGCPGGILAQGGDFTGKNIVSCSYQIGRIEGLIRGYLARRG